MLFFVLCTSVVSKGYKLVWKLRGVPPAHSYLEGNPPCTPDKADILDRELDAMLRDNALRLVPADNRDTVSNTAAYFSVPKKGSVNEERPIISLVRLNKKLLKKKFKLTTLNEVASLITPNCFMVSVDLRSEC